MGESHLSCVTHGNVTNVLDRLAGVVEVVYSGGGNLRTGSQARGESTLFLLIVALTEGALHLRHE